MGLKNELAGINGNGPVEIARWRSLHCERGTRYYPEKITAASASRPTYS